MSIYVGLEGYDYIVEDDGHVTEVSEDGRGSDVSAGRAAAVIEAACDADERRRSA